MYLTLYMVLWKAEKGETQHLLFRITHLKMNTKKEKEKVSCVGSVSTVCPQKTYLGASEEGGYHWELGAITKHFL